MEVDRDGWAQGYVRTAADHSHVEHLVIDGWHFTLCGRQALYRLRYMKLRGRCKRCQWEAAKRASTTPSAT